MFRGAQPTLRYCTSEESQKRLVKSTLMANLSTARKLSILARVATERAGKSRTFTAIWRAGRATAVHFLSVLHQLWLEITGSVFLFLAVVGGAALAREYGRYRTTHAGPGRVLLAICFTLTFAWFGVSSFWRVRRKTKSESGG